MVADPIFQVIQREWIRYYDEKELPPLSGTGHAWTKIAVDPAISQKTSADCTAMVTGSLFDRHSGSPKLYIHPHPINKRLDYPSLIETVKQLAVTAHPGKKCGVLVESVAYQAAIAQQLQRDWFDAKEVSIGRLDKRSRLALTSNLIKNGNVLFPRKGAEELIAQLVGFGVEKHDDLADAFSMLCAHALENTRRPSAIAGKGKPDLIGGERPRKCTPQQLRLGGCGAC